MTWTTIALVVVAVVAIALLVGRLLRPDLVRPPGWLWGVLAAFGGGLLLSLLERRRRGPGPAPGSGSPLDDPDRPRPDEATRSIALDGVDEHAAEDLAQVRDSHAHAGDPEAPGPSPASLWDSTYGGRR